MASKILVNLDTSKENNLIAKCKQGDDLLLEASIYENGLVLDLTNKIITIQASKSDNTYIIQTENITKENNKITAQLDRDFSSVPGTTKIEILLVEGGKNNTTFPFSLEVIESVNKGAIENLFIYDKFKLRTSSSSSNKLLVSNVFSMQAGKTYLINLNGYKPSYWSAIQRTDDGSDIIWMTGDSIIKYKADRDYPACEFYVYGQEGIDCYNNKSYLNWTLKDTF